MIVAITATIPSAATTSATPAVTFARFTLGGNNFALGDNRTVFADDPGSGEGFAHDSRLRCIERHGCVFTRAVFAWLIATTATAPSPAPSALASALSCFSVTRSLAIRRLAGPILAGRAFFFVLGGVGEDFLFLDIILFLDNILFRLFRNECARRDHRAKDLDVAGHDQFAAFNGEGMGTCERVISDHRDVDEEGFFQASQMHPLLVENIERDIRPGTDCDVMRIALEQGFFNGTKHVECNRRRCTHHSGTRAMRAENGRAFENAGPDTLARHFEQSERRNPANLDAGTVVFQRVLDAPFDGTIVPVLFHVDEIDHDETCEIPQSKLAGDFIRRFQIGADGRVLDIMFAG